MSAFLTVGSTCFDALIRQLDEGDGAAETVRVLRALGLRRLVMQIGRGEHEPKRLVQLGASQSPPFEVSYFRYSPSIHTHLEQALLVISHAGAGSILESLRLHRRTLVVVNDSLQGNHQLELAEALASKDTRHLLYTTPSQVHHALRTANFSLCRPLPPAARSAVAAVLSQEAGFARRRHRHSWLLYAILFLLVTLMVARLYPPSKHTEA